MITTAYSTKELPDAVADLKRQCGDMRPRMVVCFASAKYEVSDLSRQLQSAFAESIVMGCTTAGEIVTGKMLSDSVVAMFIDEDTVDDVSWAVVPRLSDGADVNAAFSEFERHFETPISAMDVGKYVGLVFVDGLCRGEELLMEKIGDRCDLLFVGGSAGDDLKFERTHVFVGGESYTDAAVLALLHTKNGFDIIKTQSFKTTGTTLLATRVDEPMRKVVEFDGKPAAQAYSEAVGASIQDAASLFMKRPLGIVVSGDPYVRSPQRFDDNEMVFYCQIREGAELDILDATDIVGETRSAVEQYLSTKPGIAGLIDFHCILRTLQLRQENRCDEYASIFAGIPTVGFSTYGEEYIGHINQTSTILALR